MNATMNGKARKSLAQEIDRLDGLLDGLSEGLTSAVADAVKEAVTVAVREAVQVVLAEIPNHPQLLAQLQPQATPAVNDDHATNWAEITQQPTITVRSRLATMRSWLNQKMQAIQRTCRSAVVYALGTVVALGQRAQRVYVTAQHTVGKIVTGSWQRLLLMRRHLIQIATAIGVGVALGAVGYCAQPWLAAGVSGLTGLALTWLIQPALELRRRARALLGLASA